MKEIIVIEGKEPKEVIRKLVKASGLQLFENLQNKNKISICGEELRAEQVPTNWEELKELCRATNYIQDILKKNREGQSIPVHLNDYGTGYVIIKDLYFGENGIVFYEVKEQRYIIAKDLTFAQMWGIIKNLIGENNDTTKEKEI